jgi:uncharacterized membrane protein
MFKIGDIAVIPFTLAITQALKTLFGVSGKWNIGVAIIVATILTGASRAIELQLVGPQGAMWVELVVISISGGLSAVGLFDYVREELKP